MTRTETDLQAYVRDLEEHLQLTVFGGGVRDAEGAILLVRGALAANDRPRAVDLAAATGRLASLRPGDRDMAAASAHARGVVEQEPCALEWAARRYSAPLGRAWDTEATPFGPRQRWLATVRRMRDQGWPVLDGPARWRLGEYTVPWPA